jgi:chaperonin GroES
VPVVSLKPLGDRVLLKILETEEKTEGGIFLPDTAQEKPQKGEVVAVGTGKVLADGKKVPIEVKVGDKVIFSRYAGDEVKDGEEKYLLVNERDILGVID